MSTYRNGTGCQAWPLSWIMIALSIEEVGAIVPQQGKNESNQKSAPTAHTLRNPLRPFLEVSYHNLFGLSNYSFHQNQIKSTKEDGQNSKNFHAMLCKSTVRMHQITKHGKQC
jgi:hypothetical protein